MSLSIQFTSADHEGDLVQLASSQGWAAVAEWVAGLPTEYGELHRLLDDGECRDTQELAKQLGRCLSLFPPKLEGVSHTLQQLSIAIDGGSPVESCRVVL